MSRLSIELTPEEHKRLKLMALLEGKKIREFVLGKIFADNKKKLSKETLEALEDAAEGRGLKRYETVEELFRHLKS